MKTCTPFFVIRNSKHSLINSTDSAGDGGEGEEKRECEESIVDIDDSLLYERQNYATEVNVIETSDGTFMLDFADDHYFLKGPVSAQNQISGTIATDRIYMESNAWDHLKIYADLLGKVSELQLLKGGDCTKTNGIQFDVVEGEFTFFVVENDAREVIHTLLPLERLLSWQKLVKARSKKELRWSDIRTFLSEARHNVPFIDKNGLLRHVVKTHVTFLQFVIFSRLLQVHLDIVAKILPLVGVRLAETTTSTIQLEFSSSQDCVVTFCILPHESAPPTASTMRCQQYRNPDGYGVRSASLTSGVGTSIQIDSLNEDTAYAVYSYIEKQDDDGRVLALSTDGDIIKSRLDVVTERQPGDIFPSFEHLERYEQEVELAACIKDKSVRSKANVNGVVIPQDDRRFESDDWVRFIQWWQGSEEVRFDFCMREMLFAAESPEIRRSAEMNGIVMSDRRSQQANKREMWQRRFSHFYFGRQEIRATDAKDDKPTRSHLHPNVFTIGQVDKKMLQMDAFQNNLQPCGRTKKATSNESPVEVNGDNLGEDEQSCEDDGDNVVGKKVVVPLTLSLQGSTLALDHNRSLSMPRKDPVEIKYSPCDAIIKQQPVLYESPASSDIEIKSGRKTYVGKRCGFLEGLSQKIDKATSNLRKITSKGSHLRGIELFRSKVRLIMLLQKLAPGRQNPLHQMNEESFDIFKKFDSKMYDFDALAAKQEKPKPVQKVKDKLVDPKLLQKAKIFHDNRLLKRSVAVLHSWARHSISTKKRIRQQNQMAGSLFQRSIVKKYFNSFRIFVCEKKKVKPLDEGIGEPTAEEENAAEEYYRRSFLGRCFRQMRNHAALAKSEKPVTLEDIVLPPTGELELMETEDKISLLFRKRCRSMFATETVEQCVTPLTIACRTSSVYKSVCEGECRKMFHDSLEIERNKTNKRNGRSTLGSNVYSALLIKDMLRNMKLQKLSGKGNLYDVPAEVVNREMQEENFEEDDYLMKFNIREKSLHLASLI